MQLPGGPGECRQRVQLSSVVPIGEAGRCAEVLWSPGPGGRVPVCLQSSGLHVMDDGTMVGLPAGGLLDLVNHCLLIS